MNSSVRLAAGVAAVALVMGALGLASPSAADADGPNTGSQVSINR